MNIISLGSDCCVTYQLKKHGFREVAYPFDWIRCSLLDTIRLIGNKFEDMTEDLYFTRTSTNFKFTINLSELEDSTDLAYIYKSKRYSSLEFCHDFKDDHLGNLAEVSMKFSRRASRFLEVFNNKPCVFIHYTTKPISSDILELWDFSISKELYIISPLVSDNNNYKYIRFIQDISDYDTWHRNNFKWLELFNRMTNQA